MSTAIGPARWDTSAEDKKYHRKLQNRKNQRAHRSRVRAQDPGVLQGLRPFKVRRWRLDEPDQPENGFSPNKPSEPAGVAATCVFPPRPRIHSTQSMATPQHDEALPKSAPTTPDQGQTPFVFPLSTDHLLHLIQYNVFRAFISNKRTLNVLLTGRIEGYSPGVCPISVRYQDDTTIFPLNPNIPPSLFPTSLQQVKFHSSWINLIPFPRVRDNLIRGEGHFNHRDLLEDLVGELMGRTPALSRQETPVTTTMSDTGPLRRLPLATRSDEDEVTAGRRGLIVWGEPHLMQSWEATPAFIARWSWAVEGCDELIQHSNRWRRIRGEEPMLIS